VHFPRDESPGALNPAWPTTIPVSDTARLFRGLHAWGLTQDMGSRGEENLQFHECV